MRILSASFLLFCFIISDAGGATYEVDVNFCESGVVANDEEYQPPWVKNEDRGCVELSKTYVVDGLPWNEVSGLSIAKDGLMRLDFSGGGGDYTAGTTLQLPMREGKILFGSKPLTIDLEGGEHASGAWQIEARVEIREKTDSSESD